MLECWNIWDIASKLIKSFLGMLFSYPIIPKFHYSIIPNQDSLPVGAGPGNSLLSGQVQNPTEQEQPVIRRQGPQRCRSSGQAGRPNQFY